MIKKLPKKLDTFERGLEVWVKGRGWYTLRSKCLTLADVFPSWWALDARGTTRPIKEEWITKTNRELLDEKEAAEQERKR